MPRNASGNYSLPAGNPVVSGTIISSSWANDTMPDLGNEITNSLSRNGNGAMLAPLKHVDGSELLPSITFNNDLQSGLYLAAEDDIRVTVNTTDVMRWVDGNTQVWDGAVWKDALQVDFDGPDPSLADSTAAIIIGTDDPDANRHIAAGGSIIQAKADATTADILYLNMYGGDVYVGPGLVTMSGTARVDVDISVGGDAVVTGDLIVSSNTVMSGTLNASGAVSLGSSGGVSLAETTTAALGGLLANNQSTGAGLERVLTESDLTGTDYAGFTRGGTTYIVNDSTAFNGGNEFDMLTLGNTSTLATVGPTGSGAANIWPLLDSLPADATHIIVAVRTHISNASGSSDDGYVYAAWGGATTGLGDNSAIFRCTLADGESLVGKILEANIPLDSSRRFKLAYYYNLMTSTNGRLAIKGFRTP